MIETGFERSATCRPSRSLVFPSTSRASHVFGRSSTGVEVGKIEWLKYSRSVDRFADLGRFSSLTEDDPATSPFVESGGRCWSRTNERVSGRIYSPHPLATWITYQKRNAEILDSLRRQQGFFHQDLATLFSRRCLTREYARPAA